MKKKRWKRQLQNSKGKQKEKNERREENNEKMNMKRRNKPGNEPGDTNRNKHQNLKMRAATQNITVGSVVSHMGMMKSYVLRFHLY